LENQTNFGWDGPQTCPLAPVIEPKRLRLVTTFSRIQTPNGFVWWSDFSISVVPPKDASRSRVIDLRPFVSFQHDATNSEKTFTRSKNQENRLHFSFDTIEDRSLVGPQKPRAVIA